MRRRNLAKSRGVSDELDSIKDDIGHLRGDVASFGRALFNAGRGGVSGATSRLASGAQERLDVMRESLESARDAGRKKFESFQEGVEERPLISLAVAFGLGLLLGKMLGLTRGR